MDFLFGVFFAPFILFGVLWTGLVWWSWILFIGGIAAVEAFVYKEEGEWAFFWLMLTAVVIAYMLVPEATDASWYEEIWAAIKIVIVGFIDYVILGLLFALPLWFWQVRKRLVSLREELYKYVQKCATNRKLFNNMGHGLSDDELSEAQILECQGYKQGDKIPDFMTANWSEYRRYTLRVPDGNTKVSNNIDTISSYVFLWPFHYITLFFGDFLAKIPRWFVHYFGGLVDRLSKLVRIGIPAGIDD